MLTRYTKTLLTKSIQVAMFFMTTTIYAQNNFQREWDYRYGGTKDEKLKVFLPTYDKGYLLAGSSLSINDGDKTQGSNGSWDYYVVRTDSAGVRLWDARFGGSLEDELTCVLQTGDGGFLLGGFSRSGISGDKSEANWDQTTHNYADYWIVKINAQGVKQWDKRFGGIYEDKLNAIVISGDDGYLLGGHSLSSMTGDKTQASFGGPDYWVVKIDASGNKIWDKTFGGNRNDQLTAMTRTKDGAFILAGHTWSDQSGDISFGNRGLVNYCDYWIMKMDAQGNQVWDKRYGGAANDILYSIIESRDEGFLMAGNSYSSVGGEKTEANNGPVNTSDIWVIKTDNLGNIQWDKSLGGSYNENKFGNITQTSDNGFFIAATSYSQVSGDKTENNLGQENNWVVKLDPTGNVLWDKTIFTSGRDDSGFAYLLNDGSIVAANHTNGQIAGYKSQDTYDITKKYCDFWIVKLSNVVPPVADFMYGTDPVCSRTCIDFTNLSVNAISYQWSFPGGNPATSIAQNPTGICYNTAGTFDVMLIVTNNYGVDTMFMPNYINVLQSPTNFTVSAVNDTLFASPGYTAYAWYFNGSPILSATGSFFVPQATGDYFVSAVSVNGCGTSAHIDYLINSVNSLNDNSHSVSIYPNPAGDNFVISMNSLDTQKPITISIFDQVSKLVATEKINSSSAEINYVVNSSSMKSGLYWIRIMNGDKMMRKSVIITK